MTLRRYPEYQESGVPWLGVVPRHWEIGPGLSAFREKHVKNTELRERRVLSLSYGRIVVKPDDKLHGLVPESFETYQIVDPGDIIIRSTDLQNDWNSLRVGLVQDRGIITAAYLCLQAKGRTSPEFTHLLLHAYDLKKVFYGLGSGLRQNLGWSDFKRMPTLIPEPREQASIVRFLQAMDHRINRLIRTKQRLIELLDEQKQAIIHRAVTRGLDLNVPLKPSGISCVGDIPRHWTVRRIRTLVHAIEQGISPQAEAGLAENGAWGVLKAGCVNHGVFRELQHKRLSDGFVVDPGLAVRVGDVLISRACGSPKLVGSVARVPLLRYKLILSDKTFRPVFKEPRLVDFAVAAMNSGYFRFQVEQAISGAEGLANNLPLSSLKDFKLAVPPPSEAEHTAATLRSQLTNVEAAITRAQREIELIREYRTRLVADVVTGQLDVRQAAIGLPGKAGELAGLKFEAIEPTGTVEEETLEEVADET